MLSFSIIPRRPSRICISDCSLASDEALVPGSPLGCSAMLDSLFDRSSSSFIWLELADEVDGDFIMYVFKICIIYW